MASRPALWLVTFACITSIRCSLVTVNVEGGYRQLVVAVATRENLGTVVRQLEYLFSKSSTTLHASTKERFYFEEVVFVLPARPNKSDFPVERRTFSKPDVLIIEDRELPFSVQHAGCGKPGLRIYFSVSHLTKEFAHKDLVRHWVHYRYGIFDEHGYPDDPMYPMVYRVPGVGEATPYTVTGCTNEKAVYNFRNASGHECHPASNGCYPQLDVAKNPHVVSSLMDSHASPKATQFCDGDTLWHDIAAPSMQNVLCQEQNVWSVLSKNPDFQNRVSGGPRPPTKFRYFVEPAPRFVLVLEATENLARNGRMDLIRNAFTYFALYDASRESAVAIVNLRKVMGSYSFVDVASSADTLLDSFPEAYGAADVCVECGLDASVRALKDDDSRSDGFVILATTQDISEDKLEPMTKRFGEINSKLFVIFFGHGTSPRPLLEGLALATGGKLFFVADDRAKTEQSASTLMLLYESFRSIYEAISWKNRDKVLVAQQVFHHVQEHGFLPFVIEKDVETFHVVLTGPEFIVGPPVIKDQLRVEFNGTEFDSADLTFAYRIKIPAYVFSLKNPQAGRWEVSFQRKPNYIKPVIVLVRASHSDPQKIISSRCWMDPAQLEDSVTRPPVIYAEIVRGSVPVEDAFVEATVHHYATGEEFKFRLLDSGEGNPDIRKADGIYTRCITRIRAKGYYFITVQSKSDAMRGTEPNAFARMVTCGSYYLDGQFLETDFPPRRITDLRITEVPDLKPGFKYYTVQWTAPGDEYDDGRADEYEMKVFRTRSDASANFDGAHVLKITEWETHGPWLEPEPAGNVQQVIIEPSNLTSGFYYLALRAKDAAGNQGEVSNVVQLYYAEPSTPPLPSTGTTPDVSRTEVGGTSEPSVGQAGDPQASSLEVIIGATCGVLFLMVVLAIFLLVYLSNRKRRRKATKDKISPPYFPRQRPTASEDNLRTSQPSKLISPADYAWVNNAEDNDSFNYYSLPTISRRVQDNVSLSVASSTFKTEPFPPVHAYDRHASFTEPFPQEGMNPPFNPMYTSSLRRLHEPNIHSYRLGTDV